jgi:glycosyltransferase involved in cell wall biosynthesis
MSVRSANTLLRRSSIFSQWVAAHFCDGVVSNTHAGLQTSGVAYVSKVRRWVMPNAVIGDGHAPIALPEKRPERLVLMMLGNIKIRTKGYDVAAQVVRKLRDRDLPFELRIAGRPDELPALEQMFRQLQVEQNIKFYGEVSNPEQFLREGHFYLLLSRFEGMPNTLLEALQVGLPAIATEVGDLPVLKEHGAPFELIAPEDVEAAAAGVVHAWNRWDETRRRAEEGPVWVEKNFSENRCRTVLQRILADVGIS